MSSSIILTVEFELDLILFVVVLIVLGSVTLLLLLTKGALKNGRIFRKALIREVSKLLSLAVFVLITSYMQNLF